MATPVMQPPTAPDTSRSEMIRAMILWGGVCLLLGFGIWRVLDSWLGAGPTVPISSPSPASTMDIEGPTEVLRKYYGLISGRSLDDAWALRSTKSRAQSSQARFEKDWTGVESVTVDEVNMIALDYGAALVQVKISLRRAGKVEVRRGKVHMVNEEGRWRFDDRDLPPAP